MPRTLLTAGAVICAALVLPGAADRGISFEQRLAAQGVLDRLRHAHQEGTKRPFDETAPRASLERRVRTQLQESVALEQFWSTPITPEMLQREMERIAASTLFPDRLLEIYAAFDHDPVLVQEALARPALVERLTRDFFASDERVHAEARAAAERLRERLLQDKTLEPVAPEGDASLRVVELVRDGIHAFAKQDAHVSRPRTDRHHVDADTSVLPLAAGEYEIERALSPSRVGEVSAIEGERDAFTIRRLLSEDETSARIAVYSVPKVSWQTWWNARHERFSESAALSVARAAGRLPRPPTTGSGPRRPGRGDPPNDEPSAAACPPDDTWDTRAFDTVPRVLPTHSAVWSGREIIVWGGKQAGGFRYDPLINTWRGMSADGGPVKGAAVWADGEMIVWDGEARSGARYDPVSDLWRPMSTLNAPSPRMDYPLVWTGTEMIVWGGYYHPPGPLNSGARYDPTADKWTPIANRDLPTARRFHKAYWTGREVLIWGGSAAEPVLYDPASDRWRPVRMAGGLASENARGIWTGEELVVWDLVSGWFPVAARYDFASNSWTAISPGYAELLKDYIPLAWTGEEIILWSANLGAAAFKPQSEQWRTIPRLNSLEAAADFSAIWTGNQMVLWSGGSARGARYHPVSDTWTPTAVSVSPPSWPSQALWTGVEIIIMGGSAPGASRYDPLTAQWRAVSPHASLGHHYGEGIWTGEKLIVYNGETGGRYDPLADEWLPMSQGNLPIRTHYWSLVWTGKEMILFGGHVDDRGDPSYSDSISRYDPVSDRWTQTHHDWRATDDTWGPPVRDHHSAVWTGTEMIIWGGSRDWWDDEDLGGARFNPETGQWRRINGSGGLLRGQEAFWTGREMITWSRTWEPDPPARYNPLSDSWSALSTRDAPQPWHGQAVAWTQNLLVVWGEGASGPGTGARYDPISDAWTPITTENAPAPGGKAVWMGRGLVVWGRQTAVPTEHTSGLYTISLDADRDGATTCAGDCDDRDPRIHPSAPEIPGNFADENCDGTASCDPSSAWGSDDRFIRCVTRECARLAVAGEIPRRECAVIVARAADRASCGDRTIAPHEVCDGAVVSETCADLGFDGGSLYCNDSCDGYIVSGCTSVCGDGARRGFEACDEADLGGATCDSHGYDAGELSCHRSCGGFDHSGCSSACGDGVRNEREACDGDDFGGHTCSSLGFDEGSLACSPACVRIDKGGCTTICGDGLRRGAETCDGGDLGGQTCIGLGFDSGSPRCNDTCDGFDVTRCHVCGDEVRQESETCDRGDLGGETCETQGLLGGELRCSWRCDAFDTEGCRQCGDGIKDPVEECDREVPEGDSCKARGFNFGWLLCDDECRIDDHWCSQCGDGIKADDESCDGLDLGDRTCRSEGFSGGILGCTAGCRPDASQCTSVCGDGEINRGEACDGQNVSWRGCWSFGFNLGILGCSVTCDAFDTSSCRNSVCGDGIIEGYEDCEQGDLGSHTCEGFGFKGGGSPSCTDWCGLDLSSCIQCGNGVREADEICDGDSVGEATCEMLGYPGGTLRCNHTCDGYSTFECAGCGDGDRNWGERCDGAWLDGQTCESLGFLSGSLACKLDCSGFDTSACTNDCTPGVCGDGIRHCSEECDGGDFANETCSSLGYSGGLLACGADCHLDTTGCFLCGNAPGCGECGNGVRQYGEACDGGDLDGQTCQSLTGGSGTLACRSDCLDFDISGCESP